MIMRNDILRKSVVFGIIMLFVLLGCVPNIGGKVDKNINTEKEVIVKQNIYNEQKLPLGLFELWYLHAKINITIYTKCLFTYQPKGNDFFNILIITALSTKQSPVCTIKAEPTLDSPFEITYLTGFSCNIIILVNPKTNLTTPIDPDGGYIEGNAILLHLPLK
jgi:hypothetical protein